MFNLFQLLRRLKTRVRYGRKVSLAISRMKAKTRWVPSEDELQRGRAILLEDFEQEHNLPLQEFARRTNKTMQQLHEEIENSKLLTISINSKSLKVPDWQLNPVKLQLTQSVLKHASDVDSWTLYWALSLPLEGLDGRPPVDAVTADSVDRVTDHVLSLLSIH